MTSYTFVKEVEWEFLVLKSAKNLEFSGKAHLNIIPNFRSISVRVFKHKIYSPLKIK